MEDIHILLFYKFVEIEKPEKLVEDHLEFCKKIGLLGKILIAKEGINGSVCGPKEKTEKYKEELMKDNRFSNIVFKEDVGNNMPFSKMTVRVKEEIIAMKKKIEMKKTGKYITPKEFLDIYENDEDVIILDARNDYEWKVGRFKNAKTLGIKTFKEFPEYVKKELSDFKDKKIVSYCTGGIRCEKATAYMLKQGFKKVYQLKDGIINFCKEYPNTSFEGKCFVFDKRLVSDMGSTKKIGLCFVCDNKCDLYRNCKNLECDAFVLMCEKCEIKMNACCSEKCLKEFRKLCAIKSKLKQGKRTIEKKPLY